MGLSKEKQKLVDRLRTPRLRAKSGAFLVEGIRGTEEFLHATLPLKLRFALVSSRLEELQSGASLREGLVESGIPVEELSDSELRAHSATENPQGVILVVDEPGPPDSAWEEMPGPRILFLDGIQDPGNVGTLVRAARAFGLDGVVALDGTADPWSPKAIRAGAGAMAHTPVVRTVWGQAQDWIQRWSLPILAATAGGEEIRGIRIPGGWALVVGNEGAGVRPEIMKAARQLISIPMAAGVDSLNVAAAGAVLLYALGGKSVEGGTG
jgi:TrmH family RNA methyltransferase